MRFFAIDSLANKAYRTVIFLKCPSKLILTITVGFKPKYTNSQIFRK